MRAKLLLTLITILSTLYTNFAQDTNKDQPPVDHSYKPMTLKLDADGKKFIRLITWHQMWLSHTDNNPGTVDINGIEQKKSNDFGIRRSRFLVQAQVSPRFMIVTHWGINNQSFANGGSSAHF